MVLGYSLRNPYEILNANFYPLAVAFLKSVLQNFLKNLLFWNAWEFPVQSEFIIKKSFVLRSHLLKALKDF